MGNRYQYGMVWYGKFNSARDFFEIFIFASRNEIVLEKVLVNIFGKDFRKRFDRFIKVDRRYVKEPYQRNTFFDCLAKFIKVVVRPIFDIGVQSLILSFSPTNNLIPN